MKLATIPFEEAKRRHPKEVNTILSKLRLGKSKHKSAKGEDLTWTYEICVEVMGYSFADLLAGKAEDAAARLDAMTLDERVADQVERTHTALHAKIGHWWSGEQVPNPPEVEASARQHLSVQMRDDATYKALPQEEKDRQAEEALAQLRGTPGFMELRIPRRRR